MKQVELPRLGALTVDTSLDLIGDSCLRTNLLVKNALEVAPVGAVIEIVSDNLSAVETIPFMLANHRCVLLATVHGPQCWKLYVCKRQP